MTTRGASIEDWKEAASTYSAISLGTRAWIDTDRDAAIFTRPFIGADKLSAQASSKSGPKRSAGPVSI